ncbi:MAG: SHOCT domain-containing protein [Kiritimatiellae bacterium]|nr:SHOCT domain-containing protein [Kiritimatiellia bacterium]
MKQYIDVILQAGLFLALFCLVGCSTGQSLSTAPVLELTGEVNVQLESQSDKKSGDYSHPYDFTVDEMALEIDSLIMEDYDMGTWNKKSTWLAKPVFISQTANELPIRLATALAGAGQSEAVTFSVPGRRNTRTQGKLFVRGNQLTWMFCEIDSMPFSGSDKFWMDSDDWRIQEAPQFTIYLDNEKRVVTVLRDLQVDKGLIDRQTIEDRQWRKNQFQQDSAVQQEPTTARPPEKQVRQQEPVTDSVQLNKFQSMEEKLESLKKWSDNGLISEDEYRKEKEKILNQLQ